MMQGAIQTVHVECGFGCIRDATGGNVFSHRRALTLLESFATLEVGKGSSSSRSQVPKGPAPRRSPSYFLRLLQFCRFTSWQPLSKDTPPAKFMT
jgi:cold shock CspA family protein